MTPQQQFLDLLKNLEESSLPVDRKKYWVDKLLSGTFTDEDGKLFLDEMAAQISNMDYATKVTEADLAAKEAQLKALQDKMLPLLKAYAQDFPQMMADRTNAYKKELKEAESEMMKELQDVRGSQNQEDIEAIRKKLASGK